MSQDSYHISIKFDPDVDADLIAWLQTLPHGQRSQTIRDTLRQGLEGQPSSLILDSIRQIMADELARVLAGLELRAPDSDYTLVQDDIERTYGTKLDRMLGGFAATDSGNADDV